MATIDCCDIHEASQGRITIAQQALPENRQVSGLADIFGALADQTRLRILYALCRGELCVCDMSKLLDMSGSAVSHQLRILRNQHLVRNRRDGRSVFYSLNDDVEDLLREGLTFYNQ